MKRMSLKLSVLLLVLSFSFFENVGFASPTSEASVLPQTPEPEKSPEATQFPATCSVTYIGVGNGKNIVSAGSGTLVKTDSGDQCVVTAGHVLGDENLPGLVLMKFQRPDGSSVRYLSHSFKKKPEYNENLAKLNEDDGVENWENFTHDDLAVVPLPQVDLGIPPMELPSTDTAKNESCAQVDMHTVVQPNRPAFAPISAVCDYLSSIFKKSKGEVIADPKPVDAPKIYPKAVTVGYDDQIIDRTQKIYQLPAKRYKHSYHATSPRRSHRSLNLSESDVVPSPGASGGSLVLPGSPILLGVTSSGKKETCYYAPLDDQANHTFVTEAAHQFNAERQPEILTDQMTPSQKAVFDMMGCFN